jgi:uncharacterized protein YcfJ
VTYVLMGVGLVAGLAAGGFAGFKVGSRVTGRRARFWLIAVALLVGSTVVLAYALRIDAMWLTGTALGILAGGLTGLKYGWDAELRSLLSPLDR